MKPFKKLIPNIFILTEGETEKIYFNHLKERGCNYSLHIQVFGGNDPLKMVKRCNEIFKNRSMSRRMGDHAFCVMDVDYCDTDEFRKAYDYAERNGIRIVLSNPCFEVFFLLHFTDSIPDLTSREMKNEVSEYISGYRETGDYWYLLLGKQEIALKRSRSFILDAESKDRKVLGTNIWEIFDLTNDLKNGSAD